MSRLEALRNSRVSYAVKLRDFLRISGRRPTAYVVFFEGQDSKYYAHRIEMLRPDLAWESVNCGGKDNVLKLYTLIRSHAEHKKLNTLFFLDRDFDDDTDLPNDRNVYVTQTYSIENLYVSEQSFRRVLRDEFGLNEHEEADDSFDRCIKSFGDSLGAFLECTAALNGWVLLQRQHEKSVPGSSRANLGSISLGRAVQVGLETSTSSYTLEEIERSTGASKAFTEAEALAAVAAIPVGERPNRFRGKFQAYFYRVFLFKLSEDANTKNTTCFSKPRKVSLNLSEKNFISELCQYADTPQSLRDFLAAVPPTAT